MRITPTGYSFRSDGSHAILEGTRGIKSGECVTGARGGYRRSIYAAPYILETTCFFSDTQLLSTKRTFIDGQIIQIEYIIGQDTQLIGPFQ